MARLALSVSFKGPELSGFKKRVKRPLRGAAQRQVAGALREAPLRNLRRGGFHGRSGSFTPWPARQDFGDCPPAAKPLGGASGSIGRAVKNALEPRADMR